MSNTINKKLKWVFIVPEKPYLPSTVGEISNIVKNKNNGLLVSTDLEWEVAINLLLENSSLKKKIELIGKCIVEAYSLDSCAKTLTDSIEMIL